MTYKPMRFRRLAAPLTLCLAASPASAQFTTIFNVPPDIAPGSIGSDTQLNLNETGVIGSFFDAGAINGSSTNVEVNISGGVVGDWFDAYAGSTVNISGGTIGEVGFTALPGSTVNMTGGNMGRFFRAFSNTTVNISGGVIDKWLNAGNPNGFGSNTIVNISGGTFGTDFESHAGSTVNISGGVFTGTFLPLAGSTINISGGTFGTVFLAQTGSTVNVSDGQIPGVFQARGGSTVHVSGGNAGDFFFAFPSSSVTLSGGSTGNYVKALATSSVDLVGTSFILDGVDITSSLTAGVPFTINDRGVNLSGLYADGSPFSFDLNSVDLPNFDFFDLTAALSVTLALDGDQNGDGFVGTMDLNIALSAWNQNVPPADSRADPSGDGFVGIEDLNLILGNWNAGTPPPVNNANTVPEPTTLLLLAAGIGAVGLRPGKHNV